MSLLMPTYNRLPVAFVRGDGAWLYDQTGRAYLDGLCGIAVTNLGHCHPAVTETIQTQASTLLHTSNLYQIQAQEQLAVELSAATGMERLFFCNSGAEANEAAIKIARLMGHQRGIDKPTIIVLESAFHGRTMGALTASAGKAMKQDFGPMLEGFLRVPRNDLEAIGQAADTDPNIVAVLLEPVQGEGGVRQLDLDYLEGLRALCDRQGWLLMFDEVQSGNGRCGSLYAFQRLGVTPDVMTTAKGLGNGMPVGCCLARGDAATAFGPGNHGTTFGGNPLACAVASTVINTLSGLSLWSRADPIREQIIDAFTAALTDEDSVTDIRGLGLMLGIEVAVEPGNIVRNALDRGILINVTAGNTVRVLPPLIMTDAEAQQLGQTLADVINTTPRETS